MAADNPIGTLARPRPGTPPTPKVPRPERFVLANGLRVVAVQRREFPQVATRLVIPAGSTSDPRQGAGTASLVGSVLTEGTEQSSGIELNRRIDRLGAALATRVGYDFAEIELGTLSETLGEGFELLAEVVTAPTFPDRELERIRAEVLDVLDARLDEPANIADDTAARAVFGDDHPYGRLPIGSPEGVRSITRSDVVAFHAARYRPAGSILVIAGDIDIGEVHRSLEATLGAWSGTRALAPHVEVRDRPGLGGELISVPWDDAAQSEIRFASVGIARGMRDWIPATVANYILGGSTITGRLGANLREDKGWTYGIRSSFAAGLQPAGWMVDTAVGAEVTGPALAAITAELSRMAEEQISEEELARAREAMILSLPRAFETPARIVSRLATLEAFGLGDDYWDRLPSLVDAVTADDVRRVAQAHFAPRDLVRVVVGPPLDT